MAQGLLPVNFSWIADPKLRGIVETFHTEAVAAYEHRLYVSAVVLSGAVLEGLLTFALKRRDTESLEAYRQLDRRARGIADWSLEDLIGVALKIGLLGEGAAKAAQAVRDFRNRIHPDKLVSRSDPRWDALAVIAMGAVCRSKSQPQR